MDLGEFNTSDAHEEGADVTITHPITRQPTDVVITVKGCDSIAFRSAKKAMERKTFQAMAAGKDIDDEFAENLEIGILVAVTTGWSGLVEDGKPVKFNEKNVRRLYTLSPPVRDQVDRFMSSRRNFTKG